MLKLRGFVIFFVVLVDVQTLLIYITNLYDVGICVFLNLEDNYEQFCEAIGKTS